MTLLSRVRGLLVRAAAVLACAGSLSACTASMSEKMSASMSTMPAIGLPAGTPERPANKYAFPAVHDMPPARASGLLNDMEQQRLEDDLAAARDRQQASAGTAPAARKKSAPAASTKPRVVPASSSETIY